MQRWLIAAALLGITGVAARADYFIIKVNLASTKDKKPTDPNGQYQQPGASGMMPGAEGMAGAGAFGFQGGGSGVPPGFGGQAPGMGMAGGPGRGMGGRGFGGGRGGMGLAGAPGGEGLGGGMGMNMGMAGRGGMGAGNLGMRGGVMGMQGMGMAGGGMLGAMGGAGMKGLGGSGAIMNQNVGDEEDDSKELFVGTIIEAKSEDVKLLQSGRWSVKHKWGKTILFVDNNDKEIEIHHIKLLTVAQQYAREKVRLKGVDLALWALAHGLYDEVPKIMDELLKNEPKNPIAQLFQKTEAALTKEVKGEDSSLKWRDKLGEFKEERSKHYVLCFDVQHPDQIKQRLQRLEDNMRGFYYWFALHGKALPVPDKRLVAFLVENKETFLAKHKDVFDDDELIADGFYDRHENIAVYSAYRLDDAYAALDKITAPMWKSMNFKASDLLKGRSTPGVTANENARAQTLTLLQKGMQDESELNSVSFEGTRQLLEVVGYLPKGVEIPKWFDFGVASIFEIPKGAFWHGTGSQNQAYVAQFQIWDEDKKLEKPAEALLGVVTDKYFRRVAEAKNKENSENKARTLAWMLSNYLVKKRLDGMIRYCAELQQLPRDLELNEDVLALTFARAFGLCEAANPDKIDQSRWAAFATDWFKSARGEILEVVEVKNLRKRGNGIPGKAGLSTETESKPGDPGSYIR